jgi:tetratricopeptide (TPR) repeat protein
LTKRAYQTARLSELELPEHPQHPEWARWATVRHYFGISAFGINAWTARERGQELIGEHDELGPRAGGHEELYFVVSGHARFTVDGDTFDAPAGTFVFVGDPGTKRAAVSRDGGTTVLVVGAKPGEPFEPSPWERAAPAFAYFATEEFDKAIEVLARAHRDHPDDAGVLFNLACAESRSGDGAAALSHLAQAIELDDQFRDLARSDSDFDSIPAEPGFSRVVESAPAS